MTPQVKKKKGNHQATFRKKKKWEGKPQCEAPVQPFIYAEVLTDCIDTKYGLIGVYPLFTFNYFEFCPYVNLLDDQLPFTLFPLSRIKSPKIE